MAGEESEVICLDSSDDGEETPEILQDPPGKILFEKFVTASSALIKEEKKKATVVGLMEKRFIQAKEGFRESEEFANILTAHITELETKKKDAFKHILDVVNVLKSAVSGNAKKSKTKHAKSRSEDDERTSRSEEKKHDSDIDMVKSASKLQDRPFTSGSELDSAAVESDSYTQLKEESQKASQDQSTSEADTTGQEKNDSGSLSVTEKTPKDNDDIPDEISTAHTAATKPVAQESDNENIVPTQPDSDGANVDPKPKLNPDIFVPVPKPPKKKKKVTNRQIRKYERLLQKLSIEIKRLSEKELTLDEMDEEDSAHILEYQLRNRATKVYEKLCELKEVQVKTGRVSERRIKFEGTRYPEINKKLEKLANLPDYFPDFQDVYILITKVNDRKNLRIDRKRMHNIAKDAFELIGKKLQQRRQEDFLANFSSHPTLDFVEAKDPAEMDLSLQQKLKDNWRLGNQNLNQITKRFEEQQSTHEEMGISMDLASAESDASHEHNDDDDDDDDIIRSPKKKKRRVNLITITDEEDTSESGRDSHAATTEDDTADEATGHSAHEADDEDDESDGVVIDVKDDDDLGPLSDDNVDDLGPLSDDGADDFGPLSPLPLTDDEDEDIITDDEHDDLKSPSSHRNDEKQQSEHNTSHSSEATSNNISSGDLNSASDSNASATKNGSASLSNGLSKDHDVKKPEATVKTKSIANGSHPTSAAQVVDSSSSLPIISNITSLRHGKDKATDGRHPSTAASAPGRVDPIPCPGSAHAVSGHSSGMKNKKTKSSPKSRSPKSSGTALEKLPDKDTSAPEPPGSPCSSPQVSSSRSPSWSRRRKQTTGESPEEIMLSSSDHDSEILVTSEEDPDTKSPTFGSLVGPHIPLTRVSSGPQGDASSSNRDGRPARRIQTTVVRTSTPHAGHDAVCWHHRHFGPPSRPRNRGNIEVISLSDSD